jgi:hypothetical protein
MRLIRIVLLISILTTAVAAFATIFGSVRGVIHDPQHRPIQGAMVHAEVPIVRLDKKREH